MKLLLSIFVSVFLVSCSRGIDDVPLQKRYKMAFALRVCSTMEIFVDNYKKNPLENTWTYAHGFTTTERRDEFVLNLSNIGMQVMTRAYQIPADYVPNPKSYTFDEIAASCPKIHSEFMRIPF